MSETNSNAGLIEVFKEFISHSKSQNSELYSRMDDLATNQKETTNQVQYLAKAIEKATLQHDKLSDDVMRIESVSKQTGVKLGNYIENNDNRVMDVEKQVLLLDAKENNLSLKFDKKDKIWSSILVIVVSAAIVIFLGLN